MREQNQVCSDALLLRKDSANVAAAADEPYLIYELPVDHSIIALSPTLSVFAFSRFELRPALPVCEGCIKVRPRHNTLMKEVDERSLY